MGGNPVFSVTSGYPTTDFGYDKNIKQQFIHRLYIGHRKKPQWLKVDFILDYFGKKISTAQKRYREFVNAFVNKEYGSPLKETVASTILGGIDFVEEIKGKYLDGKKVDRDLPALAELTTGPTIEEITNEVEMVMEEDTALSRTPICSISFR